MSVGALQTSDPSIGRSPPASADSIPVQTAPLWIKAIPLLLLAGLCVYANSFGGLFFFDDETWIVNNPLIGDFWAFVNYWRDREVIAASLWLNYTLSGKSLAGFHALNLAVHLAAGLALFGLIRRSMLLPRWQGKYDSIAPWIAFSAALLWLVHPLQTQAVTYLIQRCESIMGLFYLLIFYCLVRSDDADRPWLWWLGAWMAYFIGVHSKEVILTAPFLAILYDRMFLADSWKELARRRGILHLGLWLQAFLTIRHNLLRAQFGDETIGFTTTPITPVEYFITQSEVVLFYLQLAFWPLGQCLDYQDWPVVRDWREAIVSLSLLGALGLTTIVCIFRRHWFGFLGAWFYVILSPTSSVVPIVDLVFEHRMYLSLAAVSLFAVIVGHAGLGWIAKQAQWPELTLQRARVAALVVVGTFLGIVTLQRNQVYLDRIALWSDVYAKRPDNVRAMINLGGALFAQGKRDEALVVFEEGLKRKRNPLVLMGLGTLYLGENDFEKAEPLLLEGHENMPKLAQGSTNLAILYARMGKWEQSIARYRQALKLKSTDGNLWFALGAVLEEAGKPEDAKTAYKKGRDLQPSWPDQINLSARRQLFDVDRREKPYLIEAMLNARQACEGGTTDKPGHFDTLVLAFSVLGRYPDAARAAREGLTLAQIRGDTSWERVLAERLAIVEKGMPIPLLDK